MLFKTQNLRRRPILEGLETRKLLAGDVAAGLSEGVLELDGDGRSNSVVLTSASREKADTSIVSDGTTSVFLDLELLEAAAGLTLQSADGTVPPINDSFLVGFDITEDSSFQFSSDKGFNLVGGSIEHTGTVSFLLGDEALGLVTLGDFSIGFDASRVSDTASGFFVADTVSLNIPVFDLSSPGVVEAGASALTIGSTDLLLSPELATALAGENSGLAGADVGDAQVDALLNAFQEREVEAGRTSVFLNTELLASAAGLNLTGLNGTATPATDEFQVAFDIGEATNFQFSSGNTFTSIGGSIEHTGSVTFNENLELGNFSIGFDANRAGSGFFVADTITLDIPLFDIDEPSFLDFSDPDLVIDQADLLVAPELASALGNESLAGAVVGNARIDALVDSLEEEFIKVIGRQRFGRTTINGERFAEFAASEVSDIQVDLGGGLDLINTSGLRLDGSLTIDLGSGFLNFATVDRSHIGGELRIQGGAGLDRISVNRSQLGDLEIDSGAGADFVRLTRSHVTGDADIDLGAGWFDTLSIWRSEVDGDATLDGGSGRFDRLNAFFSSFGSLDIDGFERRRVF